VKMKIYDITAEISKNLPIYGNGQRPNITFPAQTAKGDTYNISQIDLSSHTGTHADMPLHFVDGATNCVTTPLEHFFGPAKVFRIHAGSHIRKADLEHLDIQEGDIILLNTGQSQYMSCGTFKEDYIALTTEAAQYLADKKIKTLGIDYLSIDPYGATDFAVHKILLGSGIAALEGLVLTDVPEGEYVLSALPLKIPNGDGSPVRAVLAKY